MTNGILYMGDPFGDAIGLSHEEYLVRTAEQRIFATRKIRDEKIASVEWRIRRYQDEDILGLPHSDDIIKLAAYVQALRDVPQQEGFPEVVVWPTLEANDE